MEVGKFLLKGLTCHHEGLQKLSEQSACYIKSKMHSYFEAGGYHMM